MLSAADVLLAVTILGIKFSGREALIAAVVIVVIVAAVWWFALRRR